MKIRKGVSAIIFFDSPRGTEYLLLKRKLHWKGWEFAKGGVKIAETKKMAVRREMREETGLKPLKIKRFNFSGKYKYDKKYLDRKGLVGQSFTLYAVGTRMKDAKIDNIEHSDYIWLDFEKALEKLRWENQKKSLKIVNLWLKTR